MRIKLTHPDLRFANKERVEYINATGVIFDEEGYRIMMGNYEIMFVSGFTKIEPEFHYSNPE